MTAQAQQVQWRAATVDNTPLIENDGDMFAVLKTIRQQYYTAANRLAARLDNEEFEGDLSAITDRINELRLNGDRVGSLIPVEDTNAEANVVDGCNGSDGSRGSGATSSDSGGTSSSIVELSQDSPAQSL